MQFFLNDDLIYKEGGKSYPNPPGPQWKKIIVIH